MRFNLPFCSYLTMLKWLQNNLLTCPFKKLTGFDCPGCGFQRALIALLQGDIVQSLRLYPAAIPLLLLLILSVTGNRYPVRSLPAVKKGLYGFAAIIITASYLFKISACLRA